MSQFTVGMQRRGVFIPNANPVMPVTAGVRQAINMTSTTPRKRRGPCLTGKHGNACNRFSCQILSRVKCLSACVSMKRASRPRLHSTASVNCAARAFGSPITVRSNPRAYVQPAAPPAMLKSVSSPCTNARCQLRLNCCNYRVSFTPHRAARKSFVHDMWHNADKKFDQGTSQWFEIGTVALAN